MRPILDANKIKEGPPQYRHELRELLGWIEKTPAQNTVKGMYIGGILETLDHMNVRVESALAEYLPSATSPLKVHAFKDYPLRGYMKLLLDSAITLYGEQTPRQGLTSLGRLAIPTFAKSISGAVIMGTVGKSWELALKCVSRGYQISLKPGQAIVAEIGSDSALVQLRRVWNYGDSYQVGVIEGLMEWCGLDGDVTAHAMSLCDVDLKIRWERKSITKAKRKLGVKSEPPRASV
jgi:uncharacterized protein (TIGR02265 family)